MKTAFETHIQELYGDSLNLAQYEALRLIINAFPETILVDTEGTFNDSIIDLLAVLAKMSGKYQGLIKGMSLAHSLEELRQKILIIESGALIFTTSSWISTNSAGWLDGSSELFIGDYSLVATFLAALTVAFPPDGADITDTYRVPHGGICYIDGDPYVNTLEWCNTNNGTWSPTYFYAKLSRIISETGAYEEDDLLSNYKALISKFILDNSVDDSSILYMEGDERGDYILDNYYFFANEFSRKRFRGSKLGAALAARDFISTDSLILNKEIQVDINNLQVEEVITNGLPIGEYLTIQFKDIEGSQSYALAQYIASPVAQCGNLSNEYYISESSKPYKFIQKYVPSSMKLIMTTAANLADISMGVVLNGLDSVNMTITNSSTLSREVTYGWRLYSGTPGSYNSKSVIIPANDVKQENIVNYGTVTLDIDVMAYANDKPTTIITNTIIDLESRLLPTVNPTVGTIRCKNIGGVNYVISSITNNDDLSATIYINGSNYGILASNETKTILIQSGFTPPIFYEYTIYALASGKTESEESNYSGQIIFCTI